MKNHLVKLTSLGLVTLTLTLAAAVSHAQEATNTPVQSTPAPKKHRALPFHGTVSAVDTGAETLTVGNLTLNITSTTRITNATNGVPAILADITVGETVSGSYLNDTNGQLNAKSIHIGTKAGKHKKKRVANSEVSQGTNSVPAN